jgi:hypothetical protein
MNRDQAIRAVADKIGLSGPFTNNLVDAMEAVGVLKLEEPASAASAGPYAFCSTASRCSMPASRSRALLFLRIEQRKMRESGRNIIARMFRYP